MARDWIRLPSYSSKDEAEKCAPDGWQALQIEQLYEQLPVGKRFEQKTSLPVGRVPVIDQSAAGIVGWHNEAPGVSASSKSPVVTFANHTCEMRLMERPFSVIQNVFPLVGRDNVCRTKFFYYLTKGRVWLEEYKGHFPDFRRKWILCPPYRDQERLTKVLGDLDKKISLNLSSNQTLEAMAQAIFQSWFVDFDPVKAKIAAKAEGRDPLRAAMSAISGKADAELDALPTEQYEQLAATAALFPDEMEASELGDIPKGWNAGAFKDCCLRVESGGTPSRKEAAFWGGSIPWLTSGEVRDVVVLDTKEKISRAGLEASSAKLWPTMSTVVAMYGATAGQVCLIANEMTANQACCALIPKPAFKTFIFIAARQSVQQLAEKASGSAQQNLNKSLVENHVHVIPDDGIAEKFELATASLLQQWVLNQREAATLAQLRDNLLPKLLSGELLATDAMVEAVA